MKVDNSAVCDLGLCVAGQPVICELLMTSFFRQQRLDVRLAYR